MVFSAAREPEEDGIPASVHLGTHCTERDWAPMSDLLGRLPTYLLPRTRSVYRRPPWPPFLLPIFSISLGRPRAPPSSDPFAHPLAPPLMDCIHRSGLEWPGASAI